MFAAVGRTSVSEPVQAGARAADQVGVGTETDPAARLRMVSQSTRGDRSGIVRTRGFWSGPVGPAIVGQARHAVAGFAATGGVSGVHLDDVRVCVSEAVANAVMHAFRDSVTDGTITISAEFSSHALTVIVADDGIGFLPRSDSPGLGIGLPIISALSESMTIATRTGGGTEVTIAFLLVNPTHPRSGPAHVICHPRWTTGATPETQS